VRTQGTLGSWVRPCIVGPILWAGSFPQKPQRQSCHPELCPGLAAGCLGTDHLISGFLVSSCFPPLHISCGKGPRFKEDSWLKNKSGLLQY
jgi:hypothetical protein